MFEEEEVAREEGLSELDIVQSARLEECLGELLVKGRERLGLDGDESRSEDFSRVQIYKQVPEVLFAGETTF